MAEFPPDRIEVVQGTKPVLTYNLTNFRNTLSPNEVIDITGYAFELVVRKRTGAEVWALNGTIVTAADGSFKFSLTHVQTFIPVGDYDAEIRWWASPPANRHNPDDAVVVPYIVKGGSSSWS